MDKASRAFVFSQIQYIVDKLHYKGHTGDYCALHCNPNNEKYLDTINTQVCEQINAWIGRYKYMMKHMNFFRFNFFLFILLDEYNNLKLNKNIDKADVYPITTTKFPKRKATEIIDNFEDELNESELSAENEYD